MELVLFVMQVSRPTILNAILASIIPTLMDQWHAPLVMLHVQLVITQMASVLTASLELKSSMDHV